MSQPRGDLLIDSTPELECPERALGVENLDISWSLTGWSLVIRTPKRQPEGPGSDKRHSSAFTLIELLLVLVILGVLAAIVVPKFSGRTEQARRTAATTQISTFGTALDSYEVDTGSYPQGKNGLNLLVQAPREGTGWQGPYLKTEVPLDPWGHPYIYECPGKQNPSGYDLSSMGPDARAGTDDDITNWKHETN